MRMPWSRPGGLRPVAKAKVHNRKAANVIRMDVGVDDVPDRQVGDPPDRLQQAPALMSAMRTD